MALLKTNRFFWAMTVRGDQIVLEIRCVRVTGVNIEAKITDLSFSVFPRPAGPSGRGRCWRGGAAVFALVFLFAFGAAAQTAPPKQPPETLKKTTLQLFKAVELNDMPAVKASIKAGADLNAENDESMSAADVAELDALVADIERRGLGVMLLIHAESSRVLDMLIERHHTPKLMKKHGAALQTMTRPNFVEYEAIQRAVQWCEITGGRLYIVHMSTNEGTDIIKAAQARGVNVLAETCVQYLVLDDSRFSQKDGHLYATCPQLKKKRDQQRLWKGLRDGEVCVISTDTCSFNRKQKAMWKGDWTKIPMGMPGLETLMPLVYTEGVLKRKITLAQFVEKCSTNPAKVMGLYPQKGSLDVGTDADLYVFHPRKKIKVDWRKMETNTDWSPVQGWELAGFAESTFCRGRQIVDHYRFVGENGYGRFLPRKPFG